MSLSFTGNATFISICCCSICRRPFGSHIAVATKDHRAGRCRMCNKKKYRVMLFIVQVGVHGIMACTEFSFYFGISVFFSRYICFRCEVFIREREQKSDFSSFPRVFVDLTQSKSTFHFLSPSHLIKRPVNNTEREREKLSLRSCMGKKGKTALELGKRGVPPLRFSFSPLFLLSLSAEERAVLSLSLSLSLFLSLSPCK